MEVEGQPRLALSDVFGGSSPEPEGQAPSPEPKAEPAKTEEKSVEVKPAEVAPAKVEAAEEKPEVKAEAKVETRAEETPPEEKKGEASKIDWEAEDNPHKKRVQELELQVKNTRDWATRINQEKLEFARQLEVINKKLDGTYDPTIDEKPKPTLDEAAVKGRIEASENAAYRIYGEGDDIKGKQIVEATLAKFNERFGQHQLVQMRVLNSPTPVIEAMKVMEEAEVLQELGQDPRQWKANLRKAILAEEEPKIFEKASKEIMARLSKKETVAPSLTEVRGSGKEMGEKPAFVRTPLDSVFSH